MGISLASGISKRAFKDSQSIGGSGLLKVVQSIGELVKFYYTGGGSFKTVARSLAQPDSDDLLHHALWNVLFKDPAVSLQSPAAGFPPA